MGEHHAEYAATWLVQMTVDSGSCKMCGGGKQKGGHFFPFFIFILISTVFSCWEGSTGRKGKETKGREGKGKEGIKWNKPKP